MLGAAKKQMVEIARAVLHEAKVIIFDEPTATLTPEEKKYFFDLTRDLQRRGVSIVFISHALEEALLLADRISVLRDGKKVVTDEASKFDRARIVQAMVGRDLSNTLYGVRKTQVRPTGPRVLTIRNLKMQPMVKNNSLSVFGGQITGVFGLVGSGRTETFKVVAGVLKRDFFHGGEIVLRGKSVRYLMPSSAVRDGVAYVTEDRKIEGFFETSSIARNIYLGLLSKFPRGRMLLSAREANKTGSSWIERLKVRAIGDEAKVVELSGGNQQKVVIAKSLVQQPDLVIFDEPTRGVDVGAIVEIHELINRLADEGKAVVVISSYLPEILALSDRILVSRAGKVVEEFSALEATEEKSCTRRSIDATGRVVNRVAQKPIAIRWDNTRAMGVSLAGVERLFDFSWPHARRSQSFPTRCSSRTTPLSGRSVGRFNPAAIKLSLEKLTPPFKSARCCAVWRTNSGAAGAQPAMRH